MEAFYKRLGWLTATLSPRTKAFRRAAEILAYKAIEKKKARELEREGYVAERTRLTMDRLFRQRKEKGGQCHPDWWKDITNKISHFYDLHHI